MNQDLYSLGIRNRWSRKGGPFPFLSKYMILNHRFIWIGSKEKYSLTISVVICLYAPFYNVTKLALNCLCNPGRPQIFSLLAFAFCFLEVELETSTTIQLLLILSFLMEEAFCCRCYCLCVYHGEWYKDSLQMPSSD